MPEASSQSFGLGAHEGADPLVGAVEKEMGEDRNKEDHEDQNEENPDLEYPVDEGLGDGAGSQGLVEIDRGEDPDEEIVEEEPQADLQGVPGPL